MGSLGLHGTMPPTSTPAQIIIAASTLSRITANWRAVNITASRKRCVFRAGVGRGILSQACLETGKRINAITDLAFWELRRTQARIAHLCHLAHTGANLLGSTNTLEMRKKEGSNSRTKGGREGCTVRIHISPSGTGSWYSITSGGKLNLKVLAKKCIKINAFEWIRGKLIFDRNL